MALSHGEVVLESFLSLFDFLLPRHMSSLALNMILKKRNIKYHRITHMSLTFFH